MFSLEILERDYDMTSPEGRTDFMKEAARKLTEFDEEIERNNYIDAVAGTYHVGSEDLKKLVGRMAVQIFWLCITHDTAAKSNNTAVYIHNRKHDPVPELIVNSVFFIMKNPRHFQSADRSRCIIALAVVPEEMYSHF